LIVRNWIGVASRSGILFPIIGGLTVPLKAHGLAKPTLAFIVSIFFFVFATVPRGAQAEPRFGDSTWVAPAAPSGDPATEGPRVAEPDRDRAWETALRLPFRVAFFPLRLLAMGLEESADFVERVVPPGNFGKRSAIVEPTFRVSPAFSYSGAAGPGVGASVTSQHFLTPGTRFGATGTWSLRDNRKLRARLTSGEGYATVGAGVEGLHDYRPNRRFYGIGNDAPAQRTIFLRRDNTLEGWLFVGRQPHRRIRGLVGLSDIKIGNGYNGSPRAVEVFDPAEVPFLTVGSRAWNYGAAGDLALVDRLRDPSRGVHFRAEGRRFQGMGDTNLEYDGWRLESRAYAPVFASRRVLAFRMAYQGVDPTGDSDAIPFYRLPESSNENRFAAYSSGRYRDRRLLLGQLEYRWIVWERLWAVALAQRGVVANEPGRIRYDQMHESYGGSLRYRLSDARTARLEAAKGSEGWNVYLDLKGDF
jgi:hypothetical protein